MPSSLTSGELKAWFKDHTKYNFDVNMIASAQEAQASACCQHLLLNESTRVPIPSLPVAIVEIRMTPSVSDFTLSDDARALPISPENHLSDSNLDRLEGQERHVEYLDYIKSTDLPQNHSTYIKWITFHDKSDDDTTTTAAVQKWLNQIPPLTGDHSALAHPLAAGFPRQNTLPTTTAIQAYHSENEVVVTEHEFHRRQTNHHIINERESRLQRTKTEELYLDYHPSGTNNRDPPLERDKSRDKKHMDQPKKADKTSGKNRGERKWFRPTVKGEKSSGEVTGKQWVALGQRRRQT